VMIRRPLLPISLFSSPPPFFLPASADSTRSKRKRDSLNVGRLSDRTLFSFFTLPCAGRLVGRESLGAERECSSASSSSPSLLPFSPSFFFLSRSQDLSEGDHHLLSLLPLPFLFFSFSLTVERKKESRRGLSSRRRPTIFSPLLLLPLFLSLPPPFFINLLNEKKR